jgi:Cof subfamily protein (haloacid dehalogenase superfamily)
MLPPVELIAIDIDGTLLPSIGGEVTERTRRALEMARASGIEVVIATGRRHRYASPILERAGQPEQTVLISSNGSVTRRLNGERMDHFTLPLETSRGLCGALRPFGGTVVFTFDREGPGEMVLESFAAAHAQIHGWVEANRAVLEEINPLERAFDGGAEPIQGMICGEVKAMRKAEGWLSASNYAGTLAMQRTEYPTRDLTILDLLPPGCSKGQALARLAGYRGLAAGQVMAIGDNWNDETMLGWAGRAVVMGNGAPDLLHHARKSGWQIAPGNDEDGVARVVEAVVAERAGGSARPIDRVTEVAL